MATAGSRRITGQFPSSQFPLCSTHTIISAFKDATRLQLDDGIVIGGSWPGHRIGKNNNPQSLFY